jgi:hypothetical protein
MGDGRRLEIRNSPPFAYILPLQANPFKEGLYG